MWGSQFGRVPLPAKLLQAGTSPLRYPGTRLVCTFLRLSVKLWPSFGRDRPPGESPLGLSNASLH